MTHICVVFGGNGTEREVSLGSKHAIVKALQNLNYQVSELDFNSSFIYDIQKIKPDIVFNGMYGKWGEDGVLPTLLNFLQIPYTHSGRNASQIAINKSLTKEIANSLQIPILNSRIYTKEQILNNQFEAFEHSFLKPQSEGSTVGCVSFTKNQGLSLQDFEMLKNIDTNFFILEEYFKGIEVAIGILGNKSVGGIEIHPQSSYYDYNAKYISGKTTYITPPQNISEQVLAKMKKLTLKLHNTIGALAVSRSDFLVNGEDFKFLEINTHPGLTNSSLIPKIAQAFGISFEEIIQFLVQNATFEPYQK